MDTSAETIWLEINLGAIRRNVARLKKIAGKPVMAVVKANAYGHGMVEVSKAALKGGAECLCVARFEEALALRQAGIEAPILVMGFTEPEHALEAAGRDISLALFRLDTALAYEEALAGESHPLQVHVKVDTGMGRLGVFPEDAASFVHQLRKLKSVQVEGIFTHFSSADESDPGVTEKQIAKFDRVIADLAEDGFRPPLIHASNSAGTLRYPQAVYDAVRPGIALYGLHPSDEVLLPPDFEPALSWKTRLASIKTLPPGSGVGYGQTYITRGAEKVGVCAVGYADGLRRRAGNQVLIRGKRVPQLGSVCMDQSMYALDTVPEAQPGDEVVLIGSQGKERLSAEEVAASWGTINYEVVCGLAARIPRYYFDDQGTL